MKREVQAILNECEGVGIQLWVENEKLKFRAPKGALTETLKGNIKLHRADMISALKNLDVISLDHKGDVYEPFLLTDVQSSYLVGRGDVYAYGGIGCHAYVEVKMAKIDRDKMEKAWHRVIGKHEMLRARIMREGYQQVDKDFQYPEVKEVIVNQDQFENQILSVRNDLSQKNYEPDCPPLYELAISSTTQDSVIHFSMDMLLADSISMGIILKDLLHFYGKADGEVETLPISFSDIVRYREKDKMRPSSRIKHENDRRYWMDRIETFPDSPHLLLRDDAEASQPVFDQFEYLMPETMWKSFEKNAGRFQVTPSSALMSAFAKTLDHWSSNDAFVLNVTLMMRENIHPMINEIVGDFTSNDLLTYDYHNESFAKCSQQMQMQLWTDLEHRHYGGVDVIRELNRQKSFPILFPYVFTSTLGIDNLDAANVDVLYKTSQTPQVFIDCQVSKLRGKLSIIWSVRKGVFNEEAIPLVFEDFKNLLDKLAESEKAWEGQDEGFLSEQNPSYKTYREALNRQEENWRIDYEPVDVQGCECALRDQLEIKDAAIVGEKRLHVYIDPTISKYPNDREALNQKIVDETGQKAAVLCASIDKEKFLEELSLADDIAILDIYQTFKDVGIFEKENQIYDIKAINEQLAVVPEYESLIRRWLNALKRDGFIVGDFNSGFRAVSVDLEDKQAQVKSRAQKMTIQQVGSQGMEDYLISSGHHLSSVISGEINPVAFLFPEGESERAHAIYHDLFAAKLMNEMALSAMESIMTKKKHWRILEIGSGVGGTSDAVVPFLQDKEATYYFTDISNYFLQNAKKKYQSYENVKYAIYDLNRSCDEQGFEPGYFDIIISANTFHNAENGTEAMKLMKRALSPDGFLIFLDCIWEANALLASKGMLHTGKILDSRGADNRIFFNDQEWRNMFNQSGLSLVDTYPLSGDFFEKSTLKYYTVQYQKNYVVPEKKEIFDALSAYVVSEKKIKELTISPYLPQKNNQIDKTALTKNQLNRTEESIKNDYCGPQTVMEKAIAEIWQEVFEFVNTPDIDENFFEMGGDSLVASMAVTKMRKRIDACHQQEWNDLMNLLLKNSTIRSFARALETQSSESEEAIPDYVLVYQKGSTDPKKIWAFLVNGTGTMPIYQPAYEILKRQVSPDDMIVGLHCGDQEKFLMIDPENVIAAMAKRNAEYLADKKTDHITLIGHCFGGCVAVETARYLQKLGSNNVHVAMLDTRSWHGVYDNALFFEKGFGEMYGVDMRACGYIIDDELLKKTMRDFEKQAGRLLTEDELCHSSLVPVSIRDCFSKLQKVPVRTRIKNIFDQVATQLPDGFDETFFINSYFVFEKIIKAFTGYVPQAPYEGSVDVYLAKDLSGYFLLSDDVNEMDYARMAVKNGGERHWEEGDHFGIMESPSIDRIITALTSKTVKGGLDGK